MEIKKRKKVQGTLLFLREWIFSLLWLPLLIGDNVVIEDNKDEYGHAKDIL
jgi:hypothetical protein